MKHNQKVIIMLSVFILRTFSFFFVMCQSSTLPALDLQSTSTMLKHIPCICIEILVERLCHLFISSQYLRLPAKYYSIEIYFSVHSDVRNKYPAEAETEKIDCHFAFSS